MIKLTPYQLAVKKSFRSNLIPLWKMDLRMGDLSERVFADCRPDELKIVWSNGKEEKNEAFIKINEVYDSIPSIKRCYMLKHVKVWLSEHYPRTSDALFDGKNDAIVMAIWAKEKRVDRKDVMQNLKKNEYRRKICTKTIKARSLSKKHDWNTVK